MTSEGAMNTSSIFQPTASITMHYPPMSFSDGSFIERELLSQPPILVVSSLLPSVFNIVRLYTLVLFDCDDGYLHWLVVNHSTDNGTPVMNYRHPDTQLPGRDDSIRGIRVAVLEQTGTFSSEAIREMRNSVTMAAPFDFCALSFAEHHSLLLVAKMVIYYSGLALYRGDNGINYLAAAEGVVTAVQPYAPDIRHIYQPSVRWGNFSAAETVYRISRIAQSNFVTPGGRFVITYPLARQRQPDVIPYPVLHVLFTGQTVVRFYREYVNSLPPDLRPAPAPAPAEVQDE